MHIALILTSSLLTWTAVETRMICTWTKVLSAEEAHYSFVRIDPRLSPPSLRLYHSSWTAEGALRSCSWSDDVDVVHGYLSACKDNAKEFSDQPDGRFHVDSILEDEEDLCVNALSPMRRAARRPARSAAARSETHHAPAGRSQVRTLQRVKRGFIVPGTLWCGSGNKAPSYEDLGVFSETDRCCRQHDQCQDTILSFHSQFGVFNSNIFTMSHCDCDNKFHSCLTEAKDSISDVVGYTFFNLLKMHCFEFSHQLQCMQRNWFGMCKETQMALYADVHPPTVYESGYPAEHYSNTSTPAEHLESSTPHITAAASIVPTPSTSTSSAPSETSRNHVEDPRSELDVTGRQLSCDIYKELDECRSRILPQQRRHNLLNTDNATLYHCNCTRGLFQTLSGQTQLTAVHSVLLGHVSPSCFVTQECTAGSSSCAAVLVKADLPLLVQRKQSADVEEQRHPQAAKLKVRRTKRKLYKLCVRMVKERERTNRGRLKGFTPINKAE